MHYCEYVHQKIHSEKQITQHFMTAETGGTVSLSRASMTPGNI